MQVAPDLLGHILVRRIGRARLAVRIVETEAYEPGDAASHAFRGKTARNAAMFGPPGRLYVYFSYGNHWMMNVVTGEAGEGSAVLLRAAEPLEGLDVMAAARGRDRPDDLCSGPGKLAQAMRIDRAHDGQDLVEGRHVWLEVGDRPDPADIATSTRVGIRVGLDEAWRFYLARNRFVSRARPARPSRS